MPSRLDACASRAAPWRPRTILVTSLAAVAARSASARISSAITANPRPCSPARAATMLAFRDRRFVRSAIRLIVWTMSPISSARLPMSFITVEPSTIAWRILTRPPIVRPTVAPPARADHRREPGREAGDAFPDLARVAGEAGGTRRHLFDRRRDLLDRRRGLF